MADNPWPGGIAEQTWWFGEQCVALGGISGGIYADKPGFHNTVNTNLAKWPTNYSINPAIPELRQGPRDKARAFDWTFPEAKTRNYFRINLYCQRLMDASRARDPRLGGLYEWFGTKDGANIGWNVWRNTFSSSDDSHDWHIHFSFVTAYLLEWAGPQGVLSVLKGESLAAYRKRGGQLIGQEEQTTPERIFNMGKMLIAKGPDGHWLCDGMTRRLIPEPDVKHYLAMGAMGALTVHDTVWPDLGSAAGADPDFFGIPVSDSLELDYDRLGAAIAAHLPLGATPPTAEEIAKAVLDEDHKRSAA